jgi:hypothetical protein
LQSAFGFVIDFFAVACDCEDFDAITSNLCGGGPSGGRGIHGCRFGSLLDVHLGSSNCWCSAAAADVAGSAACKRGCSSGGCGGGFTGGGCGDGGALPAALPRPSRARAFNISSDRVMAKTIFCRCCSKTGAVLGKLCNAVIPMAVPRLKQPKAFSRSPRL